MISKTDILKMVKQVHRRSRGLPPRRLIYPAREWGVGVVIGVLLVVVVISFSTYQYIHFDTINTDIVPAVVSTVRYQDSSVARTLELYDARSNRFTAVRGAAPAVEVSAATSSASSTGAFTEPTDQPEGGTSALPEAEASVSEEDGGVLTTE